MPVRRLSRKHLLILAVAAAAVAAGSLSFAGGESSNDLADPPHTPYVRLAGGVSDGVSWQLFAWEERSQLCMQVVPAGEDPDHVGEKRSDLGGGGCGFDDRTPDGSFVGSAAWTGESSFAFGPLPGNATRIEITTHRTLSTVPLPQGKGLPAGRYWIFPMPATWPSPGEGTALTLPQPLDATGHKVPFQPF